MLVFKILSTIFVGFSCITTIIKTSYIIKCEDAEGWQWFLWNGYSLIWRAFVIVSIWLI